MTFAVPLLAAVGILLLFSGIPWSRDPDLAARIAPYIRALDAVGHRSRHPKMIGIPSLVARRWARYFPGDRREIDRRLEAAGKDSDPDLFRVEQVTWGLTCSVATIVLFGLSAAAGMGVDPRGVAAITALAFVIGAASRDWWLSREGDRRRDQLDEELPLALDLVALAVMAGESVPAAFQRVGGWLKGAIGTEFDRVISDVRSGEAVVPALENLSARMADPNVSRFVDALCTGIERGTPLAEVLRAQAGDAREARRRHLLEVGGRKEVLMLVPVVFLIMPVVVVFALFPGLVSLRLLVP